MENFSISLLAILEKNPIILEICNKISLFNGITYLVGGTVRDILFGFNYKDDNFDFDIEVHNLTEEKLISILSEFGDVSKIGAKFGVYSIKGINAEFVLPRIDGIGRYPEVKILNNISIEESLKRRDITINAIACKLPFDGIIIDPFDGIKDIKNKIIHAVDFEKFKDDPLRVFRVMRYMAIFELKIERKLLNLCKSIEISNLSYEHIYKELYLMLLYAQNPSIGLAFIEEANKIEYISKFLKYKYKNFFEKPHYTFLMTNKISIEDKNKRLIYRFAAICIKNTNKNINEIFKDKNKNLVDKIKFIVGGINKIKDCIRLKMKVEERNYKYKKFAFDADKFGLKLFELLNFFELYYSKKYVRGCDIFNCFSNYIDFKTFYAVEEKNKKYMKFLKKSLQLKVIDSYEKPLLNGEIISKFVKEKILIRKILDEVYLYQISQIDPKKGTMIKKAMDLYKEKSKQLFQLRD
jgi:tRNA nucleotidyltransferase/poly(A) polymerase